MGMFKILNTLYPWRAYEGNSIQFRMRLTDAGFNTGVCRHFNIVVRYTSDPFCFLFVISLGMIAKFVPCCLYIVMMILP